MARAHRSVRVPDLRLAGRLAIFGVLTSLILAGCAAPASNGQDADPLPGKTVAPLEETDRSIRGLYPANTTSEEPLADGASFALDARLVTYDPGTGRPIRMMAYNGQLPGPTLRVAQGSNVTIPFTNRLDQPTTVHWHGVRLENAMDGVPQVTQAPIAPGDTFTYRIEFPDEGLFWYHPHVREDVQQELGLYGAILVEGPDQPVTPREIVLLLDDILLNGDDVATQYKSAANNVLMGRYGNELLTNMRQDWNDTIAPNERVRLQLVNAANARPMNITFRGAQAVEVIALDAGYLAQPTPVERVVLAPAQRATIDIVGPADGKVLIENFNGTSTSDLAQLIVDAAREAPRTRAPLGPHERANASMTKALQQANGPIDLTWELDVAIDDDVPNPHGGHAGMQGEMGKREAKPIEWDSSDPYAGLGVTTNDAQWALREAGGDTSPRTFEQGSFARILIQNLAGSEHPMQHPIHIHGQRFLTTDIDGEGDPYLGWRDTVLVPAAANATLLVEMSNPGTWMAHCHINEHLEAGMHTTFIVAPTAASSMRTASRYIS